MNLTIPEPVHAAANAVYLFAVAEVKLCSNCCNELLAQEYNRRTSFGLILCDDCLYS